MAIGECIRKGHLKEFLECNRAEVKKMSIYEYDAEKHIQMEREKAREEGREDGRKEGRKEGVALEKRRSNELTRQLMKEKRYEDLERAVEDEAYREQLLLEFGIC